MSLVLFDTLGNHKKPFEPVEPGHARVYVCGPTTYDEAHIGHARPCIVYDVLVRFLRSEGTRVTYVRNVTDIDDKIIARAALGGEAPAVLAARMFDSYRADMSRLGNVEPDHQPKVSEHLSEIKELIGRLIERGHAYESEGDVYFAVASFPGYGKLSHRDLSQLEAGASERLDETELARKKHPYDFALWKRADPDGPSWDSPWGPGRPGWHIECSAMSMKYLGETFDLHGGGLDLVFPHHENEIAQSECATGKCFAQHWMHNGFVQVNKEKMSKSLGNFFRLKEAFDRVEPEAIRYSLLSVHYRSPFNLEVELDDVGHLTGFPQFADAEARLYYLYSTRARLASLSAKKIRDVAAGALPEVEDFPARVAKVLSDDLNTAQAIAHVSALLRAINDLCDKTEGKGQFVPKHHVDAAHTALAYASSVLGLGGDDPGSFMERVRDRRASAHGIDREWVLACLSRRASARKNKDYAEADAVRLELAEKGIEILDAPTGTTWRLK